MAIEEKFTLKKGCLIVFEGIDGTGKSTQLQLLEKHLTINFGLNVVSTREPTEGVYGHQIRALYNNREGVTLEEELDLFIKDRQDHVLNLIEPALLAKKVVLCDRYYLSTIAYQGAAGADIQSIAMKNNFAPEPDLALLFQLSPEISVKRITQKRGDSLNDFEQQESLGKVAVIFDNMSFPYIRRIDSQQTIKKVHQDVIGAVEPYLHNIMVRPE
jgi:dTMP kinase